MAWNGSGAFTRVRGAASWVADKLAATKILATLHDTNDQDLATGINACITRDNQAKPTADFRAVTTATYSLGSAALAWVNVWLSTGLKILESGFTLTVTPDTLSVDRALKFPNEDGLLATRAYADSVAAGALPPGSIIAYGGTGTPSGFLVCQGANVSRTTYADLFSAVGTTWGSGDGSTTFGTPDFRRRVLMGKGGTSVSGPGTSVGNTGGSETTNLQHSHSFSDTATTSTKSNDGSISGPAGIGLTSSHSHTVTVSGTTGNGLSSSTNNVQPSAVVGYFIKT